MKPLADISAASKVVSSMLNFVTFRLDVLNDLAKQDASKVYERECDVSLRELRVLRFAAKEPGLNQGRMVELCFLERTLVSKLLSGIVKRGLLRRTVGDEDARHMYYWLTAEGTKLLDRCEILGRAIEEEMMAALDRDERESFEHCINKLIFKRLELRAASSTGLSEVPYSPAADNSQTSERHAHYPL